MAKKKLKTPEANQQLTWKTTLTAINRCGSPKNSIPTDDDLDAFEGIHTHLFPNTYRDFMKRFGAGILSGWCCFWSPALGVRRDWDAFYWNLNHKKNVIDNFESTDAKARRLVLFGKFNSGMDYGWDPNEITNRSSNEYAIYAVARHLYATDKLADTFPEFIKEFCMGDGLLDFFSDFREDFRYPRNDFQPV